MRLLLPFLVTATIATSLSTGCASTGPAQPEYGIKEDWSATGIRRYAVRTTDIPVNKRFEELTADQKAIIISWYEKLGPGDEPPFPAEGLKPIYEAVRQGQNKVLLEGELLLIATVNSSGDVESVKVYRSPSPPMAKYVASVLMLTKFKPALCGGVPCRMDYPFTFTFKVE